MTKRSPFPCFKTSPEIIRLAAMMYVRFPLSLRNVEDLLHERGIDISHETFRFWWNRFGLMFAAEIRKKTYPADARTFQLAMASGRGVREIQRRDTLSPGLTFQCPSRRHLRTALRATRIPIWCTPFLWARKFTIKILSQDALYRWKQVDVRWSN
jgi:hypothetical protein